MKKITIPQFPASETLAISALAQEKRAKGEIVYSLSAGEPMIPTATAVTRAVMQALKEEKTHYPPVSGIPELRTAAAQWVNAYYGTNYSSAETLVVAGGKFGIFILLQALLKKGDEVLIPAPYWVSYPHMVRIFGGEPKTIESTPESGWKITPADIKKHATEKTTMLFLNNGGNPTGALYSARELEDIMAAAQALDLLVVSDEVYSGLVYDKKKFVSCGSFPKYKDNLVIIQSCSKNFAMTGLRVGFLFGSAEIVKALGSLTSQSTSGVATLSQYAALAGIKNAKTIMPKINATMQKRRDVFMNEFNKVFKQKLSSPASALYAFVPLTALGTTETNSAEFCKRAMAEANVAIVPGGAFGKEGYVRFSFGDSPAQLVAAIRALAKWIYGRGERN